MSPLPTEALRELQQARRLLEQPGLAARLSDAVGRTVESGLRLLPAGAQRAVEQTTRRALEKVAEWAVLSMDDEPGLEMRPGLHKLLAAASGAAGGAAGMAGLPIELPLSTGIIMRSILDVARANGEDLRDPAVRLEALSVFALGGAAELEGGAESGYFAVRMALARAVTEAARHVAARGIGQESAPALVRLIAQVAARFSVPVSAKAAAQTVPMVGAVGGAALNALFIEHFQSMARGHFAVRRLERTHGAEAVRAAWDRAG